MATVATHPPGSFSWIELGTSDQNAAKQFYGSLLGWTANDSPMGPSEVYTVFSLQGRKTAGCYTLMPDMKAQGIPPHWMLYIAAENADETTAKVVQAGGKVMAPAFDVRELGRMAILQDPTRATFAIWQAKAHPGIEIESTPGALSWADLMTPDPERAITFYQALFGWEIDPGKNDTSGYLHIKSGGKHIGGIPPAQHRPPNMPPHWLIYFLVTDCDASTAKAAQGGAKILVAPMTMEGVGRWSVINDPQGAMFALFQSIH